MNNQPKSTNAQLQNDEREQAVVSKDLVRVLLLYAVFTAAILVLYFTNKSSGYLDSWFTKVLHL